MRVATEATPHAQTATVGVWIYVEDLPFQCHVGHVDRLIAVVIDVLGRYRLNLQLRKCKIHIPSLAAVPVEEWPPAARTLQDVLPLAPEGLVLVNLQDARPRNEQRRVR